MADFEKKQFSNNLRRENMSRIQKRDILNRRLSKRLITDGLFLQFQNCKTDNKFEKIIF